MLSRIGKVAEIEGFTELTMGCLFLTLPYFPGPSGDPR